MKITDEMIEAAAREIWKADNTTLGVAPPDDMEAWENETEGYLELARVALEAALAVAPEPVGHSELIEEVREARDSRDGTTISKLAEVEAERDALQAKLDDVNGLARALANGHAISFQDAQVFVEGALKIQGVPGLQARLDRVRKLHRKWTYYDHEDMCPDTTEEHCEQRHHESDDIGEFYCEDMPTGDVVCEGCRDEFGERVDWPCPTVQALGGDADAVIAHLDADTSDDSAEWEYGLLDTQASGGAHLVSRNREHIIAQQKRGVPTIRAVRRRRAGEWEEIPNE